MFFFFWWTLTRPPVVHENESIGTEAKDTAWGVETRVRATAVVEGTFIHVVASVIVVGVELVAGRVAAALVAANVIFAWLLARATAVVRQALVDV